MFKFFGIRGTTNLGFLSSGSMETRSYARSVAPDVWQSLNPGRRPAGPGDQHFPTAFQPVYSQSILSQRYAVLRSLLHKFGSILALSVSFVAHLAAEGVVASIQKECGLLSQFSTSVGFRSGIAVASHDWFGGPHTATHCHTPKKSTCSDHVTCVYYCFIQLQVGSQKQSLAKLYNRIKHEFFHCLYNGITFRILSDVHIMTTLGKPLLLGSSQKRPW